MKQLFLFFSCLLLITKINAQITNGGQITYDNYSGGSLQTIKFSVGDKFVEYKDSSNFNFSENYKLIKIYDLNLNLEKTISVPQNYSWAGWGQATPIFFDTFSFMLLSDHLFNNNDELEFIVAYRAQSGDCTMGGRDTTVLYVMNENGTILHSFDIGGNSFGCSYYGNSNGVKYYSDGSTFSKLVVPLIYSGYNVYNLPGFLPCETCVSSVGIKNQNNGSSADGMRIGVYPNPSANEFVFQYELPKNKNTGELIFTNLNGVVIKTSNINNQNGSVSINMSDLSSGVYIYKLKSGDKYTSPQKIILTK
jgi:hypothetical protein